MEKKRHLSQILFLTAFLLITINQRVNLWFVIFVVSLGAAIFFGRFFCGWICPMSTIMTFVNWIKAKLKIKNNYSPSIFRSSVWSYLLLPALILTIILSKVKGFKIPPLFILVFVSGLFTFFFKEELWHKNICPFGLLQSIPARFSKWNTSVNTEGCIGCGLCEKVCSGGAIIMNQSIKKAKIDIVYCHQCFKCTHSCPTKAINYGKVKKILKEAK